MKTELLLVGLLSVLSLFTYSQLSGGQSEDQTFHEVASALFGHWKVKHSREYASPEEEAYRLSVFKANLRTIEQHNNNPANTYSLGANSFADLTSQEFSARYLTGLQTTVGRNLFVEDSYTVGADVDWVAKGFVTPVKNQGSCGSCWAFSSTGSLEALSKAKGTMQRFSEQQLVDCSRSYGNNGCSGGLMDNAFRYVEAKGITTESAYPYTAADGSCKNVAGSFKNSKHVDVNSCSGLSTAINNQVVSVAVDATNWHLYTNGVFNNCKTGLNHGVLLVGVVGGNWKIKNSWGTGWGESGYIRLSTGNTCGVCQQATYVA